MKEKKEVCLEIRILSNMIKRHVDKATSKSFMNNLTGTHGWALGYLQAHKGQDIFQKDIETAFSIRRSTATHILQLMEKNGLIIRISVEHDARLKKIVLTEKARNLHALIVNEIKNTESMIIDGIQEQDVRTFFSVVERMKLNLEKTDGAWIPPSEMTKGRN
jgi:DNA-binding MarR family transcriptional regulator